MQDTERILSQLAEVLTGRNVSVHFVDPGRPDAHALIYKARGGFRILLRPGMGARDTFRAYLHECAHIAADGGRFAVVERAPAPREVRADAGMESRADAVSAALMRLVPRHCETVHDMAEALLAKLQRGAARRQSWPVGRPRGP